MGRPKPIDRAAAFSKLLSLVCVLLVAFSGFAQAIHVHADDSKLPSHECSVCAVVHSGVIASTAYRPAPVFVRTVLIVAPEAVRQSPGFILFLRIRPPPAV